MSTEHEVHCLSNGRIIKVVLSCHGNKVSKTASKVCSVCINIEEYSINKEDILNSILGHEHNAYKIVRSCDLQCEGVCTKLPIIKG